MFSEEQEYNSIFTSNFVNINWMNDDEWEIRIDTIKYLQKEIKTNYDLRNILRELTKLITGNKIWAKYLMNDLLLNELKKVARGNSNILIHIFGKTNSGKSLLAQKLAFMLKNEYVIFAKENPNHERADFYLNSDVELVFKVEEANKKLQVLQPGSILIRDEQSKTSGEGSRIEEGSNENLRKSIRGKNINFIDCQPSPEISNSLNFVIMSLGFHIKEEITVAIVYIPMPSRKMDTTKLEPIGYLLFKKHKQLDFIRDYELRKINYIENLQKTAGQETVSLKKDEIIQDAEFILKYVEKEEMFPRTQSQWDVVIAFSGVQIRSSNHTKRVVAYAQMQLDKRSSRDEKPTDEINIDDLLSIDGDDEDPFLNFKFDEENCLKRYDGRLRDKEIYLNFLDGARHTEQAVALDITAQRVSQIVKRVESFVDFYMGHAFEKFAVEVYKSLDYEILTDTEKLAHAGDPDLIVKSPAGIIEVISLKCTRSIKKQINPRKDLAPEIKEYLERKSKEEEVKLFLEFVNTTTNDHRKEELNEKSLQHIKSINLF